MCTRLRGLISLALILLLLPNAVKAQSAATATLSIPNIEDFPSIEAYLDIHDGQGQFMHGLRAEHVLMLEDGNPVPISSIQALRPGVQFVVALNPGPALGVRNSQAISRYDLAKEALRAWANSRLGSTLDDLSLLITNGPQLSHVSDPREWLAALEADQVDARTAAPNLETLFLALTLAADPTARPGMGRAVLFITPPPETQAIAALENGFAQAQQQGVSVFVWLVSAPGGFQTQGAQRLTELAALTGGSTFNYTGDEALPGIEEYLEPLRSIYHLAYRSNVTGSGTHQVIAQVQIGGEQISSSPRSYEVDIQPPMPAFVSPPIQIARRPVPEGESEGSQETSAANLEPKEHTLQVVFDFLDGRMRPIVHSALYVDGKLEDENTAAPFDQFTWNLEEHSTDNVHQLRVEARDALGLVGSSIETPVQIAIQRPASNPWETFQQNMPLVTALIVLVAGAILLLVLVLGGRLRPSALGARRNRRRKSDPVTQPVPVKKESARRLPGWASRLQWPQRSDAPKAFAFLSRISDTDNLSIAPPIPITAQVTSIGKDPSQVDLALDDPSIEPLHARLTRKADGSFRLSDAGSIAGTWINYTPVSKEGSKLEHGDLVHIGRIGFRFTLRQPTRVRKAVVTAESVPEQPVEERRA